MFPVTYKNRFIYTVQGDPRWTADKLREYLAQGLTQQGARHVTVKGEQIHFDGNPWYGTFSRRYFFDMVSNGKITVDYRDDWLGVIYQISSRPFYYLAMFWVIIGLMILAEFVSGRSSLSQGLCLFAISICWSGLIFGSVAVINYYRFNRFMKNHLREFFNSVSGLGIRAELITSR